MQGYEKAASLDPSNTDYRMAFDVARSHAVTALVQDAAKARMRADVAGARTALAHALELDPRNSAARLELEHVHQLKEKYQLLDKEKTQNVP